MGKIEFRCDFQVYSSEKELSAADKELLKKACDAGKNAHAPYSGFHVGAAALMEGGNIIMGNNQESVAFPSGLCAERVLLFRILSEFPNEKVLALAVYCRSEKNLIKTPQTPCGACRQIIAETEQRQKQSFRMLLQGERGPVWEFKSGSDLLPYPFSL